LSHCLWSIGCRVIALALLLVSRIIWVLILVPVLIAILVLLLMLALVLVRVLLLFNWIFSRCFHGRYLGIDSGNLTLLLTLSVLFPEVLKLALLML
jgi:hypothetical protein